VAGVRKLLATAVFSLGVLAAQPALPAFDVARIKLTADQDILETRPKRTTGRFRWTTQIAYLVEYAFHMEGWRISGDTSTFGTIYQIEATYNPKAAEEQVRLMLQSLLLDRFKMTVHRVTREAEGYALSVAKGGPKMQEAKESGIPALPVWLHGPAADPAGMEERVVATLPARGAGEITGRRASMLQFTDTLQRLLNTAVLDQTGLEGRYYFAFRYATDDDPDIAYPNLFNAVKDLGLRLERHKGPVEMLVVDHVEKAPTEN